MLNMIIVACFTAILPDLHLQLPKQNRARARHEFGAEFGAKFESGVF